MGNYTQVVAMIYGNVSKNIIKEESQPQKTDVHLSPVRGI